MTGAAAKTSVRARCSLAVLVSAYLAVAVVAGAPNSPLTVLLPAGTRPPAWAADLARAAGLDRLDRGRLTAISWVVVGVALAAFALALVEAWAGRVRLRTAMLAAGASLSVAAAAPLLLSRDVYTYAAYGRIESIDHRNPYLTPLSSFPHDPFVAVSSAQWHHTHAIYGPLFTLASAGIARLWAGSPAATILAFKLLAALAVAAATGLAALAAAWTRRERASLAAALVGLNPVLVIHTVGGAHVDALIAAMLAAAAAIAVRRPRPTAASAFAVTVLVTAACLVKTVLVPVLALWLLERARSAPLRRRRTVAAHVAVAAALTFAALSPFLAEGHVLTPLASLGGVEAWASPSHLVGQAARAVAGSAAGPVVEGGFLLLFVALCLTITRRGGRSEQLSPTNWGAVLLLLALSMPFLLPWYAAWFAPLLALNADRLLLAAGAVATGVLALTLIPADPFYGYSSRGVMDGVHYGAAPALLALLILIAVRMLSARRPATASSAALAAERSVASSRP